MRGSSSVSLSGVLLACACGLSCVIAAPAAAQGSYSPYNETPAAALARYVRALADDPKDFNSLIGAGRAALELGDAQAAAGFFARADDVNPRSPMPQEGMGAVSVANGDARGAMPYFTRAQQLGATQAMLGCDRGLAYDMQGQQAKAQADYRAALNGADADEARRRLALSLAISGNKAEALNTLAPLSAKGDSTTMRVRAFILALTGDSSGALTAVDAAMPGSGSRVAPFLQRLAVLPAGEKAAAVNLGIFPDSNGTAYAYAAPTRTVPPTVAMSGTVSSDRLAGIDALLDGRSSAASDATTGAAPAQSAWQEPAYQPPAQAVQVAYSAPPPTPATVQRTAAVADPKIWLQLASGRDADALNDQYARMKRDTGDLFNGITAYVAESGDRARLVVGPFRGPSDAKIFADDLRSVGIDAFRWSNSDSDRIVPLAGE
jgi:Flp pilus assembly protein TadD